MTCPECNDIGWLLNDRHAGDGGDTGPVCLNLTACYYPTCTVEVRDIASLQVLGAFTVVYRNPRTARSWLSAASQGKCFDDPSD